LGKYIDLTNKQFNRLIVLKQNGKNKQNKINGYVNVNAKIKL